MSGPSIDLFTRHWTIDEKRQATQADFWNGRAPSFQAHKEKVNVRRRRDFVDWVAGKCRLDHAARVLDLGCGTGHYALLWSRWAAEVQAFDLSPKMIELARANAARSGIKIDFSVLDWRRAEPARLGWHKRFDLSFACRTPAICDRPTLEKMLAVTKGFGVLVGLAEQKSALKDELNEIIERDRESFQAARSVYSAFNLLWLMGYLPEVSYFKQHWTESLTLEEALALQNRYLEQAGPLTEDESRVLRNFLESKLTGGIITEEVEAVSAVIIWPMER